MDQPVFGRFVREKNRRRVLISIVPSMNDVGSAPSRRTRIGRDRGVHHASGVGPPAGRRRPRAPRRRPESLCHLLGLVEAERDGPPRALLATQAAQRPPVGHAHDGCPGARARAHHPRPRRPRPHHPRPHRPRPHHRRGRRARRPGCRDRPRGRPHRPTAGTPRPARASSAAAASRARRSNPRSAPARRRSARPRSAAVRVGGQLDQPRLVVGATRPARPGCSRRRWARRRWRRPPAPPPPPSPPAPTSGGRVVSDRESSMVTYSEPRSRATSARGRPARSGSTRTSSYPSCRARRRAGSACAGANSTTTAPGRPSQRKASFQNGLHVGQAPVPPRPGPATSACRGSARTSGASPAHSVRCDVGRVRHHQVHATAQRSRAAGVSQLPSTRSTSGRQPEPPHATARPQVGRRHLERVGAGVGGPHLMPRRRPRARSPAPARWRRCPSRRRPPPVPSRGGARAGAGPHPAPPRPPARSRAAESGPGDRRAGRARGTASGRRCTAAAPPLARRAAMARAAAAGAGAAVLGNAPPGATSSTSSTMKRASWRAPPTTTVSSSTSARVADVARRCSRPLRHRAGGGSRRPRHGAHCPPTSSPSSWRPRLSAISASVSSSRSPASTWSSL